MGATSGLHQHISSTDKLPATSRSLHFPSGLFGTPHSLKALSLPTPHVPHVDVKQPAVFHPQALPPPPGLLHILMSAEKYQVKRMVALSFPCTM